MSLIVNVHVQLKAHIHTHMKTHAQSINVKSLPCQYMPTVRDSLTTVQLKKLFQFGLTYRSLQRGPLS